MHSYDILDTFCQGGTDDKIILLKGLTEIES